MKKLLILLLALVMCLSVLTSCDQIKGFIDGIIGGEEPPVTNTQADSAITLIKDDLKDWNVTAADYQLNAYTHQGEVKVEWSVNVDAFYVRVTHDYENGIVYVDVNEESTTDVAYVLTAKVTDAEGNVRETSFNLTLPKDKLTTYDELVAAEKDATLKVQGIVVGIIKKSDGWGANSLYIQDAENKGGYYAYNLADEEIAGVEVGMTVKVTGTKDTYNGIYEVMNGKVDIVDTTIKAVTPVDYTEVFTNAADTKAEDLIYRQSMLVTVKGVELSTQNEAQGYLNFKLAGKEAYVRISSSNNCITKAEADALKALHASNFGNTADVTGIIQLYNGAFYLIPATGVDTISNIKEVEKTPAEKVATEVAGLELVTDVNSNKEIELPATGSIFSDVSITWTLTENAAAVIDNGVLKITLQREATELTLKAVVACGEVSEEKTFTIAVAAIPNTVNVIVDAPVAGQEYYFMMSQGNLDKDLFLTGEMDGYYYATTDAVDGAVKVKVVDAGEGAYYLMVGTKYATVIANGTYINVVFVDEAPAAKFTWNTELKTFVINVDGTDYIYGTRTDKSYSTFSACKLEKASDTFIAHLVEWVEDPNASVPEHTHTPCDTCGKCTAEDCTGEKCEGHEAIVHPEGVVDPVVGTPYAFGMVQKNKDNTTYYLKGGMDGYYMATTDVHADALHVYIEETTGGYYLYCMVDGVKTYINCVVSGTHVNGAYEATASTVYRYDATSKTLIAVVNDTDYWFGTRNDKTYTTVGPCAVSYAGFYCQFYNIDTTPHEHDYKDVTVEATCTTAGSVTPTCACGEIDEENVQVLPALHAVSGVCPKCELVIVNVSDLEAGTTTDAELVEGTGISASAGLTIEANGKSIDGFKFTNRLKLGGTMKFEDDVVKAGIKIVVDGPSTITVYAISSSSSATRTLRLCTLTDGALVDVMVDENVGDPIVKCVFTVEAAGTYYLGSKSSGINLYYISVATEKEDVPVVGGGSADFDTIVITANSGGDSRYTNTYTTADGWKTVNCAIQAGGGNTNPQFNVVGDSKDDKAVCLNGKKGAEGKLTSPTLKGGISKLTINFTKMFTDTVLGATVTITDLSNGKTYTYTISRELDKNEKQVVYTESWTLEAPITGDFTIEVVNTAPSGNTSSNKDRMTILDIIWE